MRRRLIDALKAAANGGALEAHLIQVTADDLASRDYRLRRASDELGDMPTDAKLAKLAPRAQELEAQVVAGELDLDRPASWPPLPAWTAQLLHALRHGPMISRSRFFEILSGDGPDRTACDARPELNHAFREWSTRKQSS